MIELSLLILLGLSHAFYMWNIQMLVNKLMSRNFAEYITSDKYQAPKEKNMQQLREEFAADLSELNRIG